MRSQHKNTMYKQHGFSLIEALVAFLILSIGMLGIASLQLISLKAGHTAELRTVAVIKTEEMLERIRNNPESVLSYISTVGGSGVSNGCNDSGGSVVLCSKAKLAKDDIYNWKLDLIANMPGGSTASIDVLAPTAGVLPTATVTVTINWQERDRTDLGEAIMTNMSYSVTAHICDNTIC